MLGSKDKSWIDMPDKKRGGFRCFFGLNYKIRSKLIGPSLTVALPHKQALNNSLNWAWRARVSWSVEEDCCCLVSRSRIKQRLETAFQDERKLDSFWCSKGSNVLQCSCWLKNPCKRWYLNMYMYVMLGLRCIKLISRSTRSKWFIIGHLQIAFRQLQVDQTKKKKAHNGDCRVSTMTSSN